MKKKKTFPSFMQLSTSVPVPRLTPLETEQEHARHSPHPADPLQPNWKPAKPRLTIFTFEELEAATHGWHSYCVLGKGRTCTVFRGMLKNNEKVAIKRLQKDPNIEERFSREYKVEKAFLHQLHHENIIELKGFCSKWNELMLVLEFVPKGTLYDHLHDERNLLRWENRKEIALGTAKAMDCMHQSIPGPIVHRDIKTKNILLDEKSNAKLIDFGSAIYQPARMSCNLIMGTEPYIAPEYQRQKRLSTKCDIYSFGVVLLELITGQKPTQGEIRITDWAKIRLGATANWDEVVPGMMDERIRHTVPLNDMMEMMKLAIDCIQDNFLERPKSNQVVDRLLDILCPEDTRATSSSGDQGIITFGTYDFHNQHGSVTKGRET